MVEKEELYGANNYPIHEHTEMDFSEMNGQLRQETEKASLSKL